MKDIDFDELDRAVGSVLGDGKEPTKSDAPATTLTAPAAAPATVSPLPSSASTPTSTPAISPATSPARKRGQFLDMVHPSANMISDMRGKTTIPGGQRKTLTPLGAAPFKAETPEKKEELAPPTAAPEEDKAPVEIVSEATVVSDTDADSVPKPDEPVVAPADAPEKPEPSATVWPDPIDITETPDSKESEAAENTGSPADDALVADTVLSDEQPTQTPFVPGVEVEKRPLGSQSGTDNSPAQDNQEETQPDEQTAYPSPENDENSDLGAAPEVSAPELAADVNSVESGESHAEEDSKKTESDTSTPAASVKNTPAASPASASGVSNNGNGIAQSIPQQYQPAASKNSDDDDDGHPLFDTEEYHQPLLAPGKKKSRKGLLIVVLLIVLLIVGGALGYMAYTMGI